MRDYQTNPTRSLAEALAGTVTIISFVVSTLGSDCEQVTNGNDGSTRKMTKKTRLKVKLTPMTCLRLLPTAYCLCVFLSPSLRRFLRLCRFRALRGGCVVSLRPQRLCGEHQICKNETSYNSLTRGPRTAYANGHQTSHAHLKPNTTPAPSASSNAGAAHFQKREIEARYKSLGLLRRALRWKWFAPLGLKSPRPGESAIWRVFDTASLGQWHPAANHRGAVVTLMRDGQRWLSARP
jgi:hypothetical protein